MNLLYGKNVLLIGAGLLGKAFLSKLIEYGATVVLADIDIKNCNKSSDGFENARNEGRILQFELDINCINSYDRLFENLKSKQIKIDTIVNNAYPRNKNYGRKLENVELDDFNSNVNLHLGGYFLCMQQASKFFLDQGYGQVINIASIYGIVPPRFEIYKETEMTMPVEYAAVKSSIIHLSKYFMRYYKGTSLKFNCISPGGIEDQQPKSFISEYKKYSQEKGMLNKEDVAGTLVYLVSDLSKYVNGQNIVVDDGWSVH